MTPSHLFLSSILDSLNESIAVLDAQGRIQYVNRSWRSFGEANQCADGETWINSSYLDVCHAAAQAGDQFGEQAAEGLMSVIERKQTSFFMEYPCHSPDEKRWFMMRVTPFDYDNQTFFVITHQDVTERKLAEEEVESLAKLDGLTGIANRRTFDEFVLSEWNRCKRTKDTICLALLDIDYFKRLNDTYGHQAGDECLKRIATLMKGFSQRPSDLCARYGGEEFALVWGGIKLKDAYVMAADLLKQIELLKIDNEHSSVSEFVTASIGLVEMKPSQNDECHLLISQADRLLYEAKASGRNAIKLSKTLLGMASPLNDAYKAPLRKIGH
jgi:diguanylate cyclase (GGDEF)-like protein